MSEQEPVPSPEFDNQAVAEALGTRSDRVRDVAYGEGHQSSVGRGDARLEVFSRTGVTRLTAPGVRIELFDNAKLDVSDGGVELSRRRPGQDASLTVVAGGGIVFTLVAGGEYPASGTSASRDPLPRRASHPRPGVYGPETPQEPANTTGDSDVPPPVIDSPDAPQVTGEALSAPPGKRPANHQQARAETEQERISLTGRLGRDPAFRTTKTGSLVGRFPLAVHREDRHTTWHTVLAFGSRAEQLQRRLEAGELTQGREVDVVGYRHTNTRPGKDRKPRKVQEVYAVAVKKR